MECRFCQAPLEHLVVDLGAQPPANRYLTKRQLADPANEPHFPLRVFVCSECWLVQIADVNRSEDIFIPEYAYFSSYAKSWVEHARRYVDTVTRRFTLDADAFVVEVASNDGYLLQHFVERGIPCLGVDPAAKTAEAAKEKGVDTVVDFFGDELARKIAGQKGRADLVLGNNVLAHVPDINDFVAGLASMVKPNGVVSVEFPHLLRMLGETQFDTIYDEHFSYYSFCVVRRIFARHGLRTFDVEELPTHGGSLRVYACHDANQDRPDGGAVAAMLTREANAGLERIETYQSFGQGVSRITESFRTFMAECRATGKLVAAYGAAAKGNTFLNTCGEGAETIDFVVDDTPMKIGKYLPGSHVPIVAEARLRETKPGVIIILPWNFKHEIREKLAYTKEWGAELVSFVPTVEVR